MQQLDAKVEDVYQEMQQKLANFALQKDLSYLQTILESKANLDEVNESLQQKANKASVASALQRKANRTDIDQLLESKVDVTDLEKIIGIIEGKVDLARFEEFAQELRHGQHFREEIHRLGQALMKKAERDDFEELYRSMQIYKADQDKRVLASEKEFDRLSQETEREIE